MRLILNVLVILLLASATQSCVAKKKYDELLASKEATDQALAETQANLQTLRTEKDALQAEFNSEKTRLGDEINAIRTDLDATRTKVGVVEGELKASQAELVQFKNEVNGLFASYKTSGLTMQERNGRLYLATAQPLQFRSSSSRLSGEQREAVDMLAEKLKSNPNMHVLVEGHTDSKKFSAESSMDNWDLSVKRAKAIVTRLIRQGVAANQLTIAGAGSNQPVSTNDTAEGRADNRRAVVRPNPDMGSLLKLGGNNN